MDRICHVNTTFIYKAGSSRRTFAIMKALVEKGHHVTQITGRDVELHPAWHSAGITFVRFPELVKYIAPAKDSVSFFRLYRFFEAWKPTVVHTHLAKAGILGRLAAKLAGVPKIVHTVHGPTFAAGTPPSKRFLYRFLERLCGRVTDHFVFVGEELRDEYIRSGICPAEKAVIIRSGRPNVDFIVADGIREEDIISLRKGLSAGLSSFLIGYIGRLVPSKNQAAAIRVLKKVRDKGLDAQLVLVGEAHLEEEKGYEKRLRKLVEDLDVSRHVHFTGYRSDVFLYMKAMDALILPSRYEGLPNVAVEAGIAGRPMVAFEVCGVKEVIKEGVTGFVVPQGDEEGMADRLVFLAHSPAVAREMGEKAGKEVRGVYTMDRMIEQEMKFYEPILKKEPL